MNSISEKAKLRAEKRAWAIAKAKEYRRADLVTALLAIRSARDYHAEHGKYPAGTLQSDQCFDDWAADVAGEALRTYEMTTEEV